MAPNHLHQIIEHLESIIQNIRNCFTLFFFDFYFYNFIFSNWIIWHTFIILVKGFFWKAGYTRILYPPPEGPPVKFWQFSYIRIGTELRLLTDLYLKDSRESLHKYNINEMSWKYANLTRIFLAQDES